MSLFETLYSSADITHCFLPLCFIALFAYSFYIFLVGSLWVPFLQCIMSCLRAGDRSYPSFCPQRRTRGVARGYSPTPVWAKALHITASLKQVTHARSRKSMCGESLSSHSSSPAILLGFEVLQPFQTQVPPVVMLSNQPMYCGGNSTKVESKRLCPNWGWPLTSLATYTLEKSFVTSAFISLVTRWVLRGWWYKNYVEITY